MALPLPARAGAAARRRLRTPEPIKYELVLVGRDGERTVAATWSWSGGTETGMDASSALSLTDMDRIEIRFDGEEKELATAML